ncbi:restriction endonuclease [Pseudomonas fluorescens]|uniref:Restriction endonuclease n=2 Tax=Pseudomonas fluorescens TaxID=294 RepID=A0A379IG79_PSEFL|nr:restriction endonuclease [Pseudomonas fluorescens]
MVQITDRGRQVLANGPACITVTWLKQFPEFAHFHAAKPQATVVLGVMGGWLWKAPRRPRIRSWLMLTRHLFNRSPKTFWHR